jgi:hypothetical protein
MDVSTKVEINKKFTRLLKHMLSIHNKTTSTHPSLQYSNQQLNLFSVAPFLFPLVLNNINIEINFDTVFELVNEIIKDTSDELYGEEMQNSLLTSVMELLKNIEGWHLAHMLTGPCRTGIVSRQTSPSAQKLYQRLKSTFSGFHSMTLDMGSEYNSGGRNNNSTNIGIHGGAIHFDFVNFNPFRVLPTIDPTFYGCKNPKELNDSALNDWFETFKDPVLRSFVSIYNNKPLPKDFLVSGAIDQVMRSKESIKLMSSLEHLRDLAKDGALVDVPMLMKNIKVKRQEVGDEIWNKNVAKSFGEVLQAVKNAKNN